VVFARQVDKSIPKCLGKTKCPDILAALIILRKAAWR